MREKAVLLRVLSVAFAIFAFAVTGIAETPAPAQGASDADDVQTTQSESGGKAKGPKAKDEKSKKEPTVGELQKQIKSLNQDIEKLTSQLNGLRSKDSALEKTNKTLDNQNKALTTQINAAKTQRKNDSTQIRKLQDDSVRIRAEIEQLKGINTQIQRQIDAVIGNYSKNKSFDSLVLSSTKQSVLRDTLIVGRNSEERKILNDLINYFNAIDLFNEGRMADAQVVLKRITRESSSVKELGEKIKKYEDCKKALIATIKKLIEHDKKISSNRISADHQIKFDEILAIIGNFMYDNSDFINYPNLTQKVYEILQLKGEDSDEPVKDFLNKF